MTTSKKRKSEDDLKNKILNEDDLKKGEKDKLKKKRRQPQQK
jgi:hypothetical protein